MIGNTILAVGAVFLFKDALVTVEKLTATRVYFSTPGEADWSYVSYNTFLSSAEVVGVDIASGPDQAVLATVDCGEVVSVTSVPKSYCSSERPCIPCFSDQGPCADTPAVEIWEMEPDSKTFYSHGLRCLILRHPEMGHLCGYVRLPKHSALHKRIMGRRHVLSKRIKTTSGFEFMRSFNSKRRRKTGYGSGALFGIDVHGGLTFSGRLKHYRAGNGLWLGFDCAHCDDLMPYAPALGLVFQGAYRDMDYVTGQLAGLASQLRALLDQ